MICLAFQMLGKISACLLFAPWTLCLGIDDSGMHSGSAVDYWNKYVLERVIGKIQLSVQMVSCVLICDIQSGVPCICHAQSASNK